MDNRETVKIFVDYDNTVEDYRQFAKYMQYLLGRLHKQGVRIELVGTRRSSLVSQYAYAEGTIPVGYAQYKIPEEYRDESLPQLIARLSEKEGRYLVAFTRNEKYLEALTEVQASCAAKLKVCTY